jgi:hypothetical protein
VTSTYSKQKAVPDAIAHILQQIYEQTGYVGAVVLAGPDPSRGGDIKVFSYVKLSQSGDKLLTYLSAFSGKYQGKYDLGHCITERKWRDHVENPTEDFAKLIYSKCLHAFKRKQNTYSRCSGREAA